VSATDPDSLIDGDGWQVSAANAVAHAVSSTVYGTPAVYFSSHWADGTPIPAAVAEELGAVVSLSPDKGQGRPLALANGDWEYLDGAAITARSFNHGTGLLVWRSPGCGTALSTVGGKLVLPLPAATGVVVRDPAGRSVALTRSPAGLGLAMVAGHRYSVQRAGSRC
jgi:hypothetical protein